MNERIKPVHHRLGGEMYKVMLENMADRNYLIERGNFEGYLASSRMFQVLHSWAGKTLLGIPMDETVIFRRRIMRNDEELILSYTRNLELKNQVEELGDDRAILDDLIDGSKPEQITMYLDSLVQRI